MFANLVAMAIANAQVRANLAALADDQAALRRVAELVARGAVPQEIFAAVATEASQLLGEQAMTPDSLAVAACNSPAPLGLRIPSGIGTATGEVLRTGRAVRVDSFEETGLAEIARKLDVQAGVAVPVVVEGRVWGALTTSTPGSPLPSDTEDRLAQFAELAAAAIANADNKAKLTASRARAIATADETRRRLQRDLHDGAQQRLVHAIISLKLAGSAAADGHPAAGFIEEALVHAQRANRELRDLVHGIMPASLTRGGRRAGLESLVADLALPVDIEVTVPRLHPQLETTAYFIVAEALTNVVKHAHATPGNGEHRTRRIHDQDHRARRRARRRRPRTRHRTHWAPGPRGGQRRHVSHQQPVRRRHNPPGDPDAHAGNSARRLMASPKAGPYERRHRRNAVR